MLNMIQGYSSILINKLYLVWWSVASKVLPRNLTALKSLLLNGDKLILIFLLLLEKSFCNLHRKKYYTFQYILCKGWFQSIFFIFLNTLNTKIYTNLFIYIKFIKLSVCFSFILWFFSIFKKHWQKVIEN